MFSPAGLVVAMATGDDWEVGLMMGACCWLRPDYFCCTFTYLLATPCIHKALDYPVAVSVPVTCLTLGSFESYWFARTVGIEANILAEMVKIQTPCGIGQFLYTLEARTGQPLCCLALNGMTGKKAEFSSASRTQTLENWSPNRLSTLAPLPKVMGRGGPSITMPSLPELPSIDFPSLPEQSSMGNEGVKMGKPSAKDNQNKLDSMFTTLIYYSTNGQPNPGLPGSKSLSEKTTFTDYDLSGWYTCEADLGSKQMESLLANIVVVSYKMPFNPPVSKEELDAIKKEKIPGTNDLWYNDGDPPLDRPEKVPEIVKKYIRSEQAKYSFQGGQVRDGNGNFVVDGNGKPVVESMYIAAKIIESKIGDEAKSKEVARYLIATEHASTKLYKVGLRMSGDWYAETNPYANESARPQDEAEFEELANRKDLNDFVTTCVSPVVELMKDKLPWAPAMDVLNKIKSMQSLRDRPLWVSGFSHFEDPVALYSSLPSMRNLYASASVAPLYLCGSESGWNQANNALGRGWIHQELANTEIDVRFLQEVVSPKRDLEDRIITFKALNKMLLKRPKQMEQMRSVAVSVEWLKPTKPRVDLAQMSKELAAITCIKGADEKAEESNDKRADGGLLLDAACARYKVSPKDPLECESKLIAYMQCSWTDDTEARVGIFGTKPGSNYSAQVGKEIKAATKIMKDEKRSLHFQAGRNMTSEELDDLFSSADRKPKELTKGKAYYIDFDRKSFFSPKPPMDVVPIGLISKSEDYKLLMNGGASTPSSAKVRKVHPDSSIETALEAATGTLAPSRE